MRVTIKENNKLTALLLLDQKGYNLAEKFIDNQGGLSNGQFIYDEFSKSYICSQDTFEKWQNILDEIEDNLDNGLSIFP